MRIVGKGDQDLSSLRIYMNLRMVFLMRKWKTRLFLRAERQADGQRTFKLIEGEPLQTSYGEDLYNRIFGDPEEPPTELGST